LWRHDRILVPPLLMLVAGWELPRLLYDGCGTSLAIALGVSAAVIVLLARGTGPSVEELQYTGIHAKFGRMWLNKEFIKSGGSNG
jgi:hypothetical protein